MAASTVQIGTFSHTKTQTNTNHHYLLSLIPKCTTLRELMQIQAFTVKTHLQNDISVLSKLIKFCVLKNTTASINHAHHLFDQIPQPDIILFNTVARGYASSANPLHAVALFASAGTLLPDRYTFPALLKACASSKTLAEGKQLHSLAIKHGLGLDTYACPALINMYAACSDSRAARCVFDSIDEPCIVAHNAIIAGYVRNGLPNEALAVFRDIQARGGDIEPTDVTMLSVLACCAMLGALDLGKWAHEYIKKRGLDDRIKVNTALIDMYAKCGSLEDAEAVFTNMAVKDTPAWSAMIVAHATHGHASSAFKVFNEMQTKLFEPDEVTFLGLLYACSHTGLVRKGFEVFRDMSEKHGIVPRIRHFGCMVDLLGRSGQLEEGYKFINELPIMPTPILWRTLLSACCSHGDFELGERVMARILELEDAHGGDYVIFSNLCAKSGNQEHVDSVRKLMRDKGVVKIPGCSSIEVNNVVHEFFAGDGDRHFSGELHRSLDELIEEMKLAGYVPDISLVSHDMGYEEKEMTLRYHSEKLAIAYGLLNTPAGSTIRVVKNLRVCGDCHSAAKFASLVANRTIVLRDVQRFHHFKEGKCSCGDYW